MTRNEKINKLEGFCLTQECDSCPLNALGPCGNTIIPCFTERELDTCLEAIALSEARSQPEPTTRKTVLEAAAAAVCGHRATDYGTPEDNFGAIAHLWSVYKGAHFTATDVAMMMALLKIARIKSGTATADSFVDLAGYAACAAECAEREKHGKA